MKYLLAFLLVTSFTTAVQSLKCYNCDSSTSFEDCKQNTKEFFCPEAFEQCAKVEVQYSHQSLTMKSFSKSCHRSEECSRETHPACKDAAKHDMNSKCEINCCTGDYCNVGVVPMISSLVVWLCALLTLVIFARN